MRAALFACAAALGVSGAVRAAPSVFDDSGRRVSLPAVAHRVVSLAPHTTELLDQAGAFGDIVAVSAYSDFPKAAQALPVIGSAHGLDIEAIARLHPDLVVAWTSGNSSSQVEAIEHLGIPVYRSDPQDLEQIAASLEALGVLTGHEVEAARHAQAVRDEVELLRREYQGRSPVRVFYEVWDQPLMTVGGSHLISRVITLCGGRNIFAQLAGPAPTVGWEAAIAADPQVIVRAGDESETGDAFAHWRDWPGVSAVRLHHLVVLPAGHITRQSPRILLGARTLCEALESARH